jgi:hypothetical protein
VSADNVNAVRATSDFKTFERLKQAGDFRPLPTPPEGFAIRELVQLTDFGVRLASDGKAAGFTFSARPAGFGASILRRATSSRILWPKDFVGLKPVNFQTLGLLRDPQGRLWIHGEPAGLRRAARHGRGGDLSHDGVRRGGRSDGAEAVVSDELSLGNWSLQPRHLGHPASDRTECCT